MNVYVIDTDLVAKQPTLPQFRSFSITWEQIENLSMYERLFYILSNRVVLRRKPSNCYSLEHSRELFARETYFRTHAYKVRILREKGFPVRKMTPFDKAVDVNQI